MGSSPSSAVCPPSSTSDTTTTTTTTTPTLTGEKNQAIAPPLLVPVSEPTSEAAPPAAPSDVAAPIPIPPPAAVAATPQLHFPQQPSSSCATTHHTNPQGYPMYTPPHDPYGPYHGAPPPPPHHYQQHPPPQPFYPNHRPYSNQHQPWCPPSGEDPSWPPPVQLSEQSSTSAGTALAVGTVLGLAASAAVRWLQGGEFSLFLPPPSPLTPPLPVAEASSPRAGASGDPGHCRRRGDDVDYDKEGENRSHIEGLSDKLGAVLAELERQSSGQRVLLERLQDRDEELRRGTAAVLPSTTILPAALADAHAQLRDLQRDMSNHRKTGDHGLEEAADRWSWTLAAALEKLELALPQLSVATQKDNAPATHSAAADVGAAKWAAPPSAKGGREESLGNEGIAEAEAVSVPLPSPSLERLEEAVRTLASRSERVPRVSGSQLLYLYVANLSAHPKVPRYRKIFTSNDTYRQKVGPLDGARDLLQALGFQEGTHCLEWLPRDAVPGGAADLAAMDREAQFMVLMEKALAALKVLQAPEAESGDELAERATSCVRSDSAAVAPEPLRLESPASPRGSSLTSLAPEALQTPDAGSILSPPATKKHATMLGHGFPPAHPLSALEEQGDGAGGTPPPSSPRSLSPSPRALSRASPEQEPGVGAAEEEASSEGDVGVGAIAPW